MTTITPCVSFIWKHMVQWGILNNNLTHLFQMHPFSTHWKHHKNERIIKVEKFIYPNRTPYYIIKDLFEDLQVILLQVNIKKNPDNPFFFFKLPSLKIFLICSDFCYQVLSCGLQRLLLNKKKCIIKLLRRKRKLCWFSNSCFCSSPESAGSKLI